MPKYECINECYVPVSGADRFHYVGDIVEGTLEACALKHFKEIEAPVIPDPPVDDVEVVKGKLSELGVEPPEDMEIDGLNHLLEAEVSGLKSWLKENKVSFQPNTGLKKLCKYKADKEAELAKRG